jgi:predicted membrane-bound spermidine synthase
MNDPTARNRRLFFIIFTVSGFSGLIYEAIWSHYLKLFLGHAAYAQTLVLAIFMGGMALGSWLMARYSHRLTNLLIAYAIVEGVIGLLGLVFHRTSIGVTAWAFDSVLPNLQSAAAAQLVKWSLGTLLILPQSILLGMTFPLMSGAVVRRFPEHSGATLAMLYFTNSLGAAVGVLISGFVLIDWVGLPGTIMTAGLLNVALALFV